MPGLDDHFEDVEGEVGIGGGRTVGVESLDEVAEAVGPGPVGVGFLEGAPAAGGVLPPFVAVGVPVIAEHLEGALGAVDLEGRGAVLLDGEAGRDDGGGGVAEVEEDLGVVLGGDGHGAAVDLAGGDGDAGEGGDALDWTEEGDEGGDAVDAEVEEAAAARGW